jgi:hypothetical protein
VGETGQARELLGAAAHAARGHVRLLVPRQYRGSGVDVAYRGQAFFEYLEGLIRSAVITCAILASPVGLVPAYSIGGMGT